MTSKSAQTTSYIIPSRPEVLIKITEEIKAEDPNTSDICKAIKNDVALFSSIISSVNSAYYGFDQQISSIEHAVSLLGLKRTFNIVRLAALKNSLSDVGPMERFWDTATEVARICAALSTQFTNIDSDKSYTLGMLHDIGIPLLMRAKPDYKDFLRTMNGLSLTAIYDAEVECYGVSHYQLSAELARKWNMSETIAEAIGRQPFYRETFKEPADENEEMRLSLCLLLLARDISDAYRHFWRLPEPKEPLIELRTALDFLGISDFDYADLKEDIVSTLCLQQ